MYRSGTDEPIPHFPNNWNPFETHYSRNHEESPALAAHRQRIWVLMSKDTAEDVPEHKLNIEMADCQLPVSSQELQDIEMADYQSPASSHDILDCEFCLEGTFSNPAEPFIDRAILEQSLREHKPS